MASFNQDSFEDSMIFSDAPMTLTQRLGYVRQLIFSRTKLEFRLLWNKIFQKEDEELGWLLNPYRQANGTRADATMLASFNKNVEDSYQMGYDQFSSTFGREKVTIYNRGVVKKSDTRSRHRRKAEKKTLGERSLEIARYMGMGVYMTSSSFPSPFMPVNDNAFYEETLRYEQTNIYTMSKIW